MKLYNELPVYKATYDLLLSVFEFTKSVFWTTDRLDGYSSREIRFTPALNAERNANWYSFRYSVRCIVK
jgi:hypothetical protein